MVFHATERILDGFQHFYKSCSTTEWILLITNVAVVRHLVNGFVTKNALENLRHHQWSVRDLIKSVPFPKPLAMKRF